MAAPQITPLPEAPDKRDDPLNFEEKADEFLGALPTFGDEANTLATAVNGYADAALVSENNANGSEIECQRAEQATISTANYKGSWSTLTGALNIPASVEHDGIIWNLKANIPDVTASEPSSLNADWNNVTFIDENGNATIPGVLTIGSNTADAFPSGTIMLFGQASAPLGWTKKLDWSDNAMLTINSEINGTTLSSGGSTNPQSSHLHNSGTLSGDNHLHQWYQGGTDSGVSFNSSGVSVGFSETIGNSTNALTVGTANKLTNILYYTSNTAPSISGSTDNNTQPLFQEIIACIKD